MVMALGLASCDPSHDDEGPNASVTSDELTQEVRITAKSEGNNNLTIFTSPTRYIQVYDADTKALVGAGTAVKYQVLPGSTEATIYVVTANQDGTLTTSGTKSIAVNNYTDLDPILTPSLEMATEDSPSSNTLGIRMQPMAYGATEVIRKARAQAGG